MVFLSFVKGIKKAKGIKWELIDWGEVGHPAFLQIHIQSSRKIVILEAHNDSS